MDPCRGTASTPSSPSDPAACIAQPPDSLPARFLFGASADMLCEIRRPRSVPLDVTTLDNICSPRKVDPESSHRPERKPYVDQGPPSSARGGMARRARERD